MNLKEARKTFKYLIANHTEWNPKLIKIMSGFWVIDGIHPITHKSARWSPDINDWRIGATIK